MVSATARLRKLPDFVNKYIRVQQVHVELLRSIPVKTYYVLVQFYLDLVVLSDSYEALEEVPGSR